MNIFAVNPDNTEELLASDLNPGEVDELREWFTYIKPLGPDMRLIGRQTSKGTPAFSLHVAGNQADGNESFEWKWR